MRTLQNNTKTIPITATRRSQQAAETEREAVETSHRRVDATDMLLDETLRRLHRQASWLRVPSCGGD